MTIWLIVLAVWLAMGAAAWLWSVWDRTFLTLGEVLLLIPMALLGPVTLAIAAYYLLDFEAIFDVVVWRRRK